MGSQASTSHTSALNAKSGHNFTIDISALPVVGPTPDMHPSAYRKPEPPSTLDNPGERKIRPEDITVFPPSQKMANPQTATAPVWPSHTSMSTATGLPRRSSSPFSGVASPNRLPRASSPRHLSPANSQIFERDVGTHIQELSPAIPSHVQIEDHIPPVLEASSLAITDTHLNPDEVEIVMHAAHQPASFNVTGSGVGEQPSAFTSHSDLGFGHEHEDNGSTYGAVDPTDLRRLSFISFADVVHAEHMETGQESAFGISMAPTTTGGRSLSPDRWRHSPPISGSTFASATARNASPEKGGSSLGLAVQGGTHGDLKIETMRQTLEKTGSNEQSGTLGQPPSVLNIVADDGLMRPLK